MKDRFICFLIFSVLILPIFILGPEQYFYAFVGLCSLLGQLAKVIGAESAIWMMILPLASIGIMIFFSAFGLSAIVCPFLLAILQMKDRTKKRMKIPPVVFAAIVLIGLMALSAFPGEEKIEFGSVYFLVPSLLLLASLVSLLLKERTEQPMVTMSANAAIVTSLRSLHE